MYNRKTTEPTVVYPVKPISSLHRGIQHSQVDTEQGYSRAKQMGGVSA